MKTMKLFGIFAMAYFAVASDFANAQGVSSGTSTIKPGAVTERPAAPEGGAGVISSSQSTFIKEYVANQALLKVHVDELQSRDLELEKEVARLLQRDREETAANTQMEKRLDAIETALRDEGKGNKDPQRAASSKTLGPQRMRAPFVVVDDNDVALVTIDRSENSHGARLTVGDSKGVSVVLMATSDSAFVQLLDQKGLAAVGIEGTPRHMGMATKGPNGSTWTGSSNEKVALVQVLNNAGFPIAEMRGLPASQSGQMSIANANGNKIMFVGETNSGVGILRMGPSGYGMANAMQNQGLPASALTGKKE